MSVVDVETREALAESVDGLLGRRWSTASAREDAPIDRELWREMGRLGWLGFLAPEASGGSDAGMAAAVVVARALGSHVVRSPFLSTAVLGCSALVLGGGAGPLERWVPPLVDGTAIAAVALSGRSGRIVPGQYDVSATPTSDDGWHLAGCANLVLDGGEADVIVVAATTGRQGAALFAIETARKGITVEPLASVDRSRPLGRVHFDDVAANGVDVVAADATAVIHRLLERGMVALAADAVGAATRAFDLTLSYAKEREQFGRAIGSFQAVKHKLANMFVASRLAAATVEGAAEALDDADDLVTGRRRAAVAGSLGRELCALVAGDAMQLHGGIGYTWEHECHLLLKRTKVDELLLSDLWAQRELLASVLLDSEEA